MAYVPGARVKVTSPMTVRTYRTKYHDQVTLMKFYKQRKFGFASFYFDATTIWAKRDAFVRQRRNVTLQRFARDACILRILQALDSSKEESCITWSSSGAGAPG
jgi:hypothetical protein